MKKLTEIVLIVLGMMLFVFPAIAQESDTTASVDEKPAKDKRPIKGMFESGVLFDRQTVVLPSAKTLEFIIQHRFGKLNSGNFDLLGLYAPSNIRIGLNYSIWSFLNVGLGTTKNNKLQDINWKWSILQQTRSGSTPFAVTYFGNAEWDAREKESFGEEFRKTHRLSYFHELIVARKFNKMFSVQMSLYYSHYNQIDTTGYPNMKHDILGASISGRVKFSPQSAIIMEYDQPLNAPEIIKPNLSIGIEVGTSAHAFQISIGSYDNISYQKNIAYNTNDFTKKDLLIGFNITRLWNF